MVKTPAWITVGEGDDFYFEGHQGHWGDTFFSNSYIREIEDFMKNSRDMKNVPYTIREMTDDEVKAWPEALEHREWLIKEYGEE